MCLYKGAYYLCVCVCVCVLCERSDYSDMGVQFSAFKMVLPLIFMLLLLQTFTVSVHGVLPPGYEDELYCPKGMCLVPAKHPRGWCGPRTHLVNCMKPLDKSTRTPGLLRPKGWGFKLGQEMKQMLLNDGWKLAEHCKNTTDPFVIAAAPLMNNLFPNGLYIAAVASLLTTTAMRPDFEKK